MQTQTTSTPRDTQQAATKPTKAESPPTAVPAVDVLEGAEGWLVIADVPGVTPADLTLSLERDHVVMSAARKIAPAVTFERTFLLPREVDREAIEASLEDGVLRLRLPRQASARRRQIPVR